VTAEILSFGERLRVHRQQRGISQAQAARELDVARTAYRLWEMEAAKPSPDRWRLISRWLGVSVATMLLAEGLIDTDEAESAGAITDRFASRGIDWDAEGGREQGDYFIQETALIDRHSAEGNLTEAEARGMRAVIDRLEGGAPTRSTTGTRSASFRKELARSVEAPGMARDAMRVTAAGIPPATLEDALLLVDELVTNAVRHPPRTVSSMLLEIWVGPHAIRASVAVAGTRPVRPLTPTPSGGWGLALVAEIASRWGAGREGGMNVIWFELDLPRPGAGRHDS
jgi:transcriptional regulator with XRE-family HTH domain